MCLCEKTGLNGHSKGTKNRWANNEHSAAVSAEVDLKLDT